MRTLLWLALVVLCADLHGAPAAQTAPQQPLCSIDLRPYAPPGASVPISGTLVFLTDHALATSLCSFSACRIVVFDISDCHPRSVAQTVLFPFQQELFRGPDGGLILPRVVRGSRYVAERFTADLTNMQTQSALLKVSPNGELAEGISGLDHWSLFKVADPDHAILQGSGTVVDLSDHLVLFKDQGAVHIEDIKRGAIGGFPMASQSVFSGYLVGDHSLLLFTENNRYVMTDFDGKKRYELPKLDGWAWKLEQSSDSSRILFDRFTRHISLLKNLGEFAVAIATMGLGVDDETSNGEMVTVFETGSGNGCFQWASRTDLLMEGDTHADLDPGGRLAAIMTQSAVAIYRLPESCPAH